jgi:hypothetical protein
LIAGQKWATFQGKKIEAFTPLQKWLSTEVNFIASQSALNKTK